MKVGFAILAHDQPRNTARLARRLIEAEGIVAIHLDAKAGQDPIDDIRHELGGLQDRVVWARRVSVGWGQWSMIKATLNTVNAIFATGHEPDYIHLMSAADYPIRPLRDFYAFLERHKGTDFVESYAVDEKQWVRDGLVRERYQYHHVFNYKRQPHLFDRCWRLQKALGLTRTPPRNLVIHMGSQWCTLTARSWKYVLEWAQRKDVMRFFRTCWIPDEMFFQTVLASGTTPHSNRHLTLYQFTDYGVPVVYCNGHASHLAGQPFFFARKISPYAHALRDELDQIVTGARPPRRFPDEEIGTPVEDYEIFRTSRRHGLKGRRIIGLSKDPWYGDLEWNTKPYFVFLGACSEELNWLCRAIDQSPGFVGHGNLFAKDRICFTGGRRELAGYNATNTQLRDHHRANFLVDIIHQFPDEVTAFALPGQEGGNIFDVLRYDKRSRLVLVKGNILRAFLRPNADGRMATKGPAEFEFFAQKYLTFYTERRRKLDEAKSRYTEIDLLSPTWQTTLADFITASLMDDDISVRCAAHLIARDSGLDRLELSDLDLARGIGLAGMILHPGARARHLRWLLEQRRRRFLLLTGASAEELRFIADILAASGPIQVHDVPVTDHINLVERIGSTLDGSSASIPAFLLHDHDGGATTTALSASTASAWIVHVRGNVLRAVKERIDGPGKPAQPHAAKHARIAAPHCDPGTFKALYDRYRLEETHWRQLAHQVAGIRVEIDLMSDGWSEDLCCLLDELFSGAEGDREALRTSVLSAATGSRALLLTDPAVVFGNARFLCTQISDDAQRLAHLRRLRSEVTSSADAVPFPLRTGALSDG